MDSQPDESRPRTRKPVPRRKPAAASKPAAPATAKKGFGQAPVWKVRLELQSSEIARVYRQGLAHGAEVRQSDWQEWRPLLATPELRAALQRSPSEPDRNPPYPPYPPHGSTITLTQTIATQTLAINDPTLAALLLERPPSLPRPPSAPPPPPPLVSPSTLLVRLPLDTIPDSEITLPLPTRAFAAPAFEPQPSEPQPRVLHASTLELAVAAALSVVGTLLVMLVVQRALHWGEARAPIAEHAPRVRFALPSARSLPAPSVVPASFPVVAVHDLPMERGISAPILPIPSSRPQRSSGASRSEFARALSRAAAAASSCGAGPVHAQVVATFNPSGVPRAVHFAGAAPAPALRIVEATRQHPQIALGARTRAALVRARSSGTSASRALQR